MTTTTKTDLHQTLMDSAYNRESEYAKTSEEISWSTSHMLMNATELEKTAVLLGNLNYQVENGGFPQWIDNGYCTAYAGVLEALDKIKSKHAETLKGFVEHCGEFLSDDVLNGYCDDRGCGGSYLDDEKMGGGEEDCCNCNGSGEVEHEEYHDEDSANADEMVECIECWGSGTQEIEAELPDSVNANSYKYYKFSEEFMTECEAYFASELAKEVENV